MPRLSLRLPSSKKRKRWEFFLEWIQCQSYDLRGDVLFRHEVEDAMVRRANPNFPHLESWSRISSIPLVETGWSYAESFYGALKRSNSLTNWSCETAEFSIHLAVDNALPIAVSLVGKDSITAVDKILCKSLDILDQRVSCIYLPPQMMLWNTKQYMNTNLVTPMMKRADSVKHLGATVLTSKYTEYAADSLDNALDVADKYVERYLPDESGAEESEIKDTKEQDENSGKAVKTIHHVDRFSRKLKRRLTRHAIAEAKALKRQSKEAIHVLIYVAELVAKDPKLAMVKAKELWISLSKDEPENQARPQNLEQLIVLLTRETARRLVHLINHTSTHVSKLPERITRTTRSVRKQFIHIADALVKTIHLEGVKDKAFGEAMVQVEKLKAILQFLNDFASSTLERIALNVAGGSTQISSRRTPKKLNNAILSPAKHENKTPKSPSKNSSPATASQTSTPKKSPNHKTNNVNNSPNPVVSPQNHIENDNKINNNVNN